ncbi:DoxX family protein [Marinifilum sp. RC60d5]|uniref:DoxX family protein n=1 Tax=Marinifilum sp. RC60d5 TaxID=3458414 RepID=UPI0040368AFE
MNKFSSVIWTGLRILFALFMVVAGVQHFLKPEFFLPFVPGFLGFKIEIIYLSGIIEIALGIFLLIKKYSRMAALGIFVLMILFLPIHIWDVFSDTPAIGTQKAALIRLPIQFLFMAIAWKLKAISEINYK